MILVDSSVWIDYFNGIQTWQTDKLDHLLEQEFIIIGDIILAEVLQGFREDKHFTEAKEALTALPLFDICGYKIALKSVENYRLLRRRGITIRKTIDMIIGTFCIENRYTLLHDDKDFDHLEKHLKLKAVKQAV